jgi:hypothetical protein
MAGQESSRAIEAKALIMSDLTTAETQRDLPAMQADLVDLLQLEFDALPTYALAIARLRRPEFRETLRLFRTEHERHVQDLSAEIRRLGGIPLPIPHLPTGLLKLGVQLAGLGGDDRTVLLAFVSNEWQSREKYARYAALPYPPDVASLLQRHAQDEARHFAWACSALQELGCGTDTPVGWMIQAFARLHGTAADVFEAAGRVALEAVARASRPA